MESQEILDEMLKDKSTSLAIAGLKDTNINMAKRSESRSESESESGECDSENESSERELELDVYTSHVASNISPEKLSPNKSKSS